jgi:hypothetical protein
MKTLWLNAKRGPKTCDLVNLKMQQLIMSIGDYIDRHNDNHKPFIWTANASDILEKVTYRQKL